MNMTEWKASVLADPKRQAMPIMTHPGIELIHRSVREVVTDGRVHAESILALAHRYPCVASTVVMDLTVEAEAFGCPVGFPEHEIPAILKPVAPDAEAVAKLAVPSIEAGRVPQYLLAAKLSAEAIKDRPVFAGCIGPFSLASRLFDMTELMVSTYTDPDMVNGLLEACTQFLLRYATALKATGASGLIMAEPAAGLLSPEMCDAFSSAYVKRVVEAVQDDSFLFVLHNCGNTGHVTGSMLSTGAKGLHFGNKIDLTRVLAEVPADILVLGNLDPVSVFKSGTPETMRSATGALLQATAAHRNFVLSSGCDTPPGVTLANIDAFYAALADFNAGR